jgi:hypothetical protein
MRRMFGRPSFVCLLCALLSVSAWADEPDAPAVSQLPPMAAPRAPVEVSEAAPPLSRLETAAWTAAGGTLAAATLGSVFLLSAEGRERDLERLREFRDRDGNPLPASDREDKLDRERNMFRVIGISALIGSAALAATSTTLFIANHRKERQKKNQQSAELLPTVGPSGIALGVRLRF